MRGTIICPVCRTNLLEEYKAAHGINAPSGTIKKTRANLKAVTVVLSAIALVSAIVLIATLHTKHYSPSYELDADSTTKTFEWRGATIRIPNLWRIMQSSDGSKAAAPYGESLYACITHVQIDEIGEVDLADLAARHALGKTNRGASNIEIVSKPTPVSLDNGAIAAVRVESKCTFNDRARHYLEQWMRTKYTYTLVTTSCDEADWNDCKKVLTQILDSLHLVNPDAVGIVDDYKEDESIIDARTTTPLRDRLRRKQWFLSSVISPIAVPSLLISQTAHTTRSSYIFMPCLCIQ